MYIFVIMINDTSMLKIEFSLKSRGVLGKEWTGSTRNEEFARLYFILNGEAEIWHHGEKFMLTPGNLYLIPPRSNMRHRCRESFEVAWIHFNISLYGHLDLFDFQRPFFKHVPADTIKTQEQMLQLLALLDMEDMCSQLRAKSIFLELISSFYYLKDRKQSGINQAKITRLSPVLDYIDQHLGKALKLPELAKLAAFEQTYFSTLFKQVFGISPIKYIQNKRIEKAQSMLRNSNLKLSAIADELGFIDAFHFSKTFKKITGENPSEFRRNLPQIIP